MFFLKLGHQELRIFRILKGEGDVVVDSDGTAGCGMNQRTAGQILAVFRDQRAMRAMLRQFQLPRAALK